MSKNGQSRLLIVIIYLAFMSLGLPDGSFGVCWPLMHREIGAPIEMAGLVVTVGTLLTALSGFSSGWVLARISENTVLFFSCVLTSLGLAGMASVQQPWFLFLAVVPLGLGAGAVDAGLNGYVAKHYTSRHMNWLHACWGIGATCGPMILAQVLAFGGTWRHAFAFIAVAQATIAVIIGMTRHVWSSAPVMTMEQMEQAHAEQGRVLAEANTLAGWLAPVVFYFYVGVEFTVGLWAGSLLAVSRGVPPAAAAAAVAGFYGSITVGRILVGLIADRVGNQRLVSYGAGVALVGIVGLALAPGLGTGAASLVLTGLGMAPIYPGLMHEVKNRFTPSAIQTVVGRQSGGASLGGATMPAIAGALAAVSLEWIPWFAAGLTLLLIVVNMRLDRLTRTGKA
ncbi:MAG: MFS transporter [Opitutaceae bacterium]|nr:MFS transporter [Opitutaceae bacterium]